MLSTNGSSESDRSTSLHLQRNETASFPSRRSVRIVNEQTCFQKWGGAPGTRLDTFRRLSSPPLTNNPSPLAVSLPPSLHRSHVSPPRQLPSQWFFYPLRHLTRSAECERASERSSAPFNPRGGPKLEGSQWMSRSAPLPVTDEHIRQGAGLVDEKESTNCLIIQIFMIMNHYSTVQEHGVQPELPPQHSSCESWLLISEWLSGTNISCPLRTHPLHPLPSTHPCFVFYCIHL